MDNISPFLSPGLNISTSHRTMSGKKKSYVRRAVVQCEVKKSFISYRRLKTQKHSVSIPFPVLIFVFMNILIDNLILQ